MIALLPGLALQWLLDPDNAPSAPGLGEAIRAVLGEQAQAPVDNP